MTDVLEGYKLKYEDMPRKKYKIRRADKISKKEHTMSKKQEATTAKTRKSYNKSRSEHYKDVLIAVLITAVVAFVAGMVAQSKQQNAINNAVKAVTPHAQAEQAPSKQ